MSIDKLNEQLKELQMEIGKSLIGESVYSAEDLSATINSTRQRITDETDKLIEVTQIVAKGNKAVDDIQPLYSQFVSWADEFRQATLEQKRIILSQLIDCIEINNAAKAQKYDKSNDRKISKHLCMADYMCFSVLYLTRKSA